MKTTCVSFFNSVRIHWLLRSSLKLVEERLFWEVLVLSVKFWFYLSLHLARLYDGIVIHANRMTHH